MFKCMCGKEFKTNSGLKTHQRACIDYNVSKAPFICECGKKCPTPAHLSNHRKYCSAYCEFVGKEVRDPTKDPNNWKRGSYFRGASKNDNSEKGKKLKKLSEMSKERVKNLGNNNPLILWNRNKPKEAYVHQSETRKRKYQNGSLKPAEGVGRGCTSYMLHSGKKYCFRSSYEFIYALHLVLLGKTFEYENIHVYYEGKTYFNDFYVDGKIVEIKGFKGNKEEEERNAFISQGYLFEVIYASDIEKIKSELSKSLDIENILKNIENGNKSKNYFVYDTSEIL